VAWVVRYRQLGVKKWGARRGLLGMFAGTGKVQTAVLWKVACQVF